MSDRSIEELVARAKKGDSAAMDKLYVEYKDKLYKFIIKQGLSSQDAEDVVSDTFVEVMKHIGDLQNDEFFGTWIHRIALRKTGELKKKSGAHQRVIFEDNEETGLGGDMAAVELAYEASRGDTVMLPSDYAENEDVKRLLAEQLDSLSPDYKEALVLFYYENKSIAEMAELCGITQNNAKVRLYKARQSLKKKVEALQKKGVTLCAVPISGLLAELDEGGKGAAAAATAGEATVASTESAAVASSSGAKIAAVAVVAAVVVGLGFGLTRLDRIQGDTRPDDGSSEVVTTVMTTTTTTTAVPEIVDDSAEESVTVTTTTKKTTTTTTTKATATTTAAQTTTLAATTQPPAVTTQLTTEDAGPANIIEEEVIAPISFKTCDVSEHERLLNTINENVVVNAVIPNAMEIYDEWVGKSWSFRDLCEKGVANVYDDGCAYVMIEYTDRTHANAGFPKAVVQTTDGGNTWEYNTTVGFGLRYDYIALDDGRLFYCDLGTWIIGGIDENGDYSTEVHYYYNLLDMTSYPDENWFKDFPMNNGWAFDAEKEWGEQNINITRFEYKGGYTFDITICDYAGNYYSYDELDEHEAEAERINNTVLFSGTVEIDPETLRPIF